jgi:hypothetical protein
MDAERVSAGVTRYWYILIVLLSVGYFCDTYFRGSRKLFWFDELFTVYVSRLPDLRSLWAVLMAGVDFNPPLLYVLTKFSNSFLGGSPLSTRQPEIVGFWIFCLRLYRFVSLRSSALGGLISMVFPMVTLAYWYAYEARPYALELGFCGVALLCWQGAADRASRRLWWLLGLGGAFAGVLLTHGYAPRVRSHRPRGTGAHGPALASGFDGLGNDHDFFRDTDRFGSYESRAEVDSDPSYCESCFSGWPGDELYLLLETGPYVGFGWLILMCVVPTKTHTPTAIPAGQTRLYETVALLVFLAIPALQCLVAKLTGAPPIARYSICWIAGPAALFGLASARRPAVAIATLALLIAQIGANNLKFRSSTVLVEPSVGYPISTSLPDFNQRYQWMEDADKTLPIALLDSFDFLPTAYYAPPSLVSRMTYVMPSKTDLNGFFYDRLRVFCGSLPGPPAYFSDFVASHDTFLAYGGLAELPRLNEWIKDGAVISVRDISESHFLVSVTYSRRAAGGRAGLSHNETSSRSDAVAITYPQEAEQR